MGGGGVMTSMRLRLVFSFSFGDLLLLGCGAVFWWSFQDTCCLTFHKSTMQKPRVFAAFETKASQLTPKLNNHKTRKAWYLRHFRKNATTKQEQRTLDNENPETSCC